MQTTRMLIRDPSWFAPHPQISDCKMPSRSGRIHTAAPRENVQNHDRRIFAGEDQNSKICRALRAWFMWSANETASSPSRVAW